jgi:hypothetical protein
MVALPVLLVLASAAAPIHLQAITATSGAGVRAVLDGDPATGWSPVGDPDDEGVLLRFEEPVAIDALKLTSCAGRSTFGVYVNGRAVASAAATPAAEPPVQAGWGDGGEKVASVFLRVSRQYGSEARTPPCLGEVAFFRRGERAPVAPPREVAGRVTATSTLAPAAAYHPSYLFDGRPEFGWAEGAKGSGAGEGVTVELEQPVVLTGLDVWNGYQRSAAHHAKNARARGVTVALDDRPPVAFELKDRQGVQRIALASAAPARRIRLTVTSVYPGSKYADLVLSELRLRDAAGPIAVATPDRAELRRALQEAVRPTVLRELVDRGLASCSCGYGPRQTLKLRSDHTFVAYHVGAGEDDPGTTVEEVIDGAWTLAGTRGPWAEIELFARVHRTDIGWSGPYDDAPAPVTQTERIAGGRLRLVRASALDAQALATEAAPGRPPECCGEGDSAVVLVRGPALTGDLRLHDR